MGAGELSVTSPAPAAQARVAWGPARWHGGELTTTGRITGLPLQWAERVAGAQMQAAGVTGNVVFKRAVLRIRQDVATGMQLNFSMRSTGVFPNMAVQMTAIGEESGALDDMLDKVAGFYEDEVDNMVDNLTSLMEPFIMVVLGVIVGGLVVAMYLPIFQLGSAI